MVGAMHIAAKPRITPERDSKERLMLILSGSRAEVRKVGRRRWYDARDGAGVSTAIVQAGENLVPPTENSAQAFLQGLENPIHIIRTARAGVATGIRRDDMRWHLGV